MLSYSQILAKAFLLVRLWPVLLLLGMVSSAGLILVGWAAFLPRQINPLTAAAGTAACASIALVAASWGRMVLYLTAKNLAGQGRPEFLKSAFIGLRLIRPAVAAGLLTAVFTLGAAVTLAAPMFVSEQVVRLLLWGMGMGIFFPVAFAVAAVYVFSLMFISVLGLPLRRALNAALDFFGSRWSQIAPLFFLLAAIYLAGVFLGGLAAAGLRLFFWESLGRLGFLQDSAIFAIMESLVSLLLWFWLGALNAFANTALLLFFLDRIAPAGDDRAAAELQPVPVIL